MKPVFKYGVNASPTYQRTLAAQFVEHTDAAEANARAWTESPTRMQPEPGGNLAMCVCVDCQTWIEMGAYAKAYVDAYNVVRRSTLAADVKQLIGHLFETSDRPGDDT